MATETSNPQAETDPANLASKLLRAAAKMRETRALFERLGALQPEIGAWTQAEADLLEATERVLQSLVLAGEDSTDTPN